MTAGHDAGGRVQARAAGIGAPVLVHAHVAAGWVDEGALGPPAPRAVAAVLGHATWVAPGAVTRTAQEAVLAHGGGHGGG